ncbi:MAG: sigma-54 dependent transcriptional regulator [Neomegalonema sp.]|nr:sigma-54 dependent transcriptional regulator [Neomegalonema sp.]
MPNLPAILIVDDEVRSLETLTRILEDDFEVHTASEMGRARLILDSHLIQIILCDQRMPDETGIEFLSWCREHYPDIIRMIISGYTDARDIIDGINQAGIFQYITKPWHPDTLMLTLKNAARLHDLQRENELLAIELRMTPARAGRIVTERKEQLRKDYSFEDGIVRSRQSPMNAVCQNLRQVAPFDVPVILVGESGTGKELAARALHYSSLRWNKPFVVENCGALPDQLLESELFGHRRGAFTGAVNDHIGLFERADGGTVFLDEIGETSQAFQIKLLRVLQEGEIRPVGSGKTRKVDVRVIAATNRILDEEVRQRKFRADLFYRLAGSVIRLPALRERACDIAPLSDAFLSELMAKFGKSVTGLSEEALECMQRYGWPGNVRELRNEVQRMLVMGAEGQELGADLLSGQILRASPASEPGSADTLESFGPLEGTLKDQVERVEATIIREAMIRNRWNKSQTARDLGLSRVGLRAKLERYGLENVRPLSAQRAAR